MEIAAPLSQEDELEEDEWVAEKVRERLREGEPQTHMSGVCTDLGWKDINKTSKYFSTAYLKIQLTAHEVRPENSKR